MFTAVNTWLNISLVRFYVCILEVQMSNSSNDFPSEQNAEQLALLAEAEQGREIDPVIQFLIDNQWSDFYKSLLSSFDKFGRLTEKQYTCAKAGMEKSLIKKAPPVITPDNAPKKEFSIKVGQVIEIKTWLANNFKKDAGMDFFLRNLEIVEVLNETQKAYQVRVRFVSKIVQNCCACGKALDNEISKATGIGPTCARKIGLSRPSLHSAQQTILELEALCVKIGIIGGLWIPKSQIKFIAE